MNQNFSKQTGSEEFKFFKSVFNDQDIAFYGIDPQDDPESNSRTPIIMIKDCISENVPTFYITPGKTIRGTESNVLKVMDALSADNLIELTMGGEENEDADTKEDRVNKQMRKMKIKTIAEVLVNTDYHGLSETEFNDKTLHLVRSFYERLQACRVEISAYMERKQSEKQQNTNSKKAKSRTAAKNKKNK